jgi:hypothetical protein
VEKKPIRRETIPMKRIHIFCEGQTEEIFVREILTPAFLHQQICLNPIVLRTSAKQRGGAVSYGKIRWQVEKKCKEDPTAWVTTMLDFYGLPTDFPMLRSGGDSFSRAERIEKAFQEDIAQSNFLANLTVHEFEGLLFSQPTAFGQILQEPPDLVEKLETIQQSFLTPEYINDGQDTAPSKRILSLCRSYDKITDGILIALEIGLLRIREACPRFDAWLRRLEALS